MQARRHLEDPNVSGFSFVFGRPERLPILETRGARWQPSKEVGIPVVADLGQSGDPGRRPECDFLRRAVKQEGAVALERIESGKLGQFAQAASAMVLETDVGRR